MYGGSAARLCHQPRGVRGERGGSPDLQLKPPLGQDLGSKWKLIPWRDLCRGLSRMTRHPEASHRGSHSTPRPESKGKMGFQSLVRAEAAEGWLPGSLRSWGDPGPAGDTMPEQERAGTKSPDLSPSHPPISCAASTGWTQPDAQGQRRWCNPWCPPLRAEQGRESQRLE